MPPLEQKPGSPNIDSLDPNKVEKLGRDKPVTGNDLQAGETAAGLLRADLPTNQVPGSNGELKDRIAGFRADVASSEGVGLARRAELQINGEKVRGIETTNAEGVTNFYARGGKEAWTVNTDGTYTPIKPSTGEPIAGAPVVRAEKTVSGAATSDGAAVTAPDSSVATFAQGLDSRVMKGLVQQPQFQAFAAQHDLTGVQSTRRGDTTVYTTKDGASFSFDRGDKKLSFQAGSDQPAATLTWKPGSGVQYEAPAAPGGATTPVVRPDTPVVKADTPVVKADTPAVTPVITPKPGETQVYPSGNQFTRSILDATGATKYDPKTGNLTFADGHTQGVTTVLDQLKASGQIQGSYNFNNRDDVRNLVQDLRTVNPTTFRPDGGLPGGIKPVDVGVRPVDVSGKPIVLDGAGKPIDAGKLVDATGRQLDLGRLTQQDLAKFNPDFAKMTQQDFRNLSQQDIAKMMMQDRMGGGDQMQALRLQQLQMDLQNPQLRAQMLDAMSKIQAGKLEGLGPNGQRMADIMKDLGLDKSGLTLKQLLENPQGIGKLDALTQQKLANFMDLMQGRTTADGGVPRSPFERLTDFLKVNQQALDKGGLTGEGGKAFFLELNKILKDLNTQLGLKPGEGLTVADIMGRRMQDGRLAAELGLLPGQLSLKDVRGDMFAVRLNAGETMNVRMLQLQQELMGKNMTPALRDVLNQILNPSALQQTTLRTSELGMAAQLTGKPVDILIQGVRQLDQSAIKDAAASTLLSQITRDLGLKDAGTAGIMGGKEFNAALKLDPTAIKVDAAAKAQADMAAALGQLGMRVDPSLAGVKDIGLNPLNPLDMATAKEQSAAAMKALEEEQAKQKKKKEEEEEEARLDKEQQAKDAALAALIAAKKRQELKEKEEQEKAQEKDKKEPERRTKYIVKEGDTLESIASKMLRDKRLAALIYEINKEVIPVIQRKGRDVVALRPKMVIWLPTTQEIREFRGRLVAGGGVKLDFGEASKKLTAEEELTAKFGENWDGEQGGKNAPAAGEDLEDLAADAVAAAKKRRENIEKLLGPLSGAKQEAGSRSTYVVRLGDTLKSVSMKHPLLQDVGLWKLLAEVNDMTTRTDEKGVPQAALRRGMQIAIPTAEEVTAYKARAAGGDRKTSVYASGPHDLKTKNCGGCGRATIASASICPGCFRSFDEEAKPAPNTVAPTRPAAAAGAPTGGGAATEPVSASANASGPETQPMMRDDRTRVVRPDTAGGEGPTTQIAATVDEGATDTVQISEQVRVSRHGEVELHGLKLRLEMRLTGTYWLPVLGYEIFEDVALRHEYNADGSRRTVRIDLPPQAAKELAENDITSNWRVYCDKFASTAGAPRP